MPNMPYAIYANLCHLYANPGGDRSIILSLISLRWYSIVCIAFTCSFVVCIILTVGLYHELKFVRLSFCSERTDHVMNQFVCCWCKFMIHNRLSDNYGESGRGHLPGNNIGLT